MTAPAHAPVAAGLTTEGRLQLLLDLHHEAPTGENLSLPQLARLREYVPTRVPMEQAIAGFRVHAEVVAKIGALYSGRSPETFPELAGRLDGWTEEYRRDAAIDCFKAEAAGLLWSLASGEM